MFIFVIFTKSWHTIDSLIARLRVIKLSWCSNKKNNSLSLLTSFSRRGTYEPRSANLRQRPGHSGVRNDVRAGKQKGTTATIFTQYFRYAFYIWFFFFRYLVPDFSDKTLRLTYDVLNRACRRRGETTLPLAQGATADGDAVFLGIVSRRDVPHRICHRRIYALIYNAIIFIILPAIRIPYLNSLHSPIISLLLFSRFLNPRTGAPWCKIM